MIRQWLIIEKRDKKQIKDLLLQQFRRPGRQPISGRHGAGQPRKSAKESAAA